MGRQFRQLRAAVEIPLLRVTCPPISRHFTFTEGSRLVRVRCYLHDDTHAAEGWYPPAERVLEFSKPFYWS